MQQKERISLVLKKLPKLYPYAHCALDHKNAFELLIATILSAQCTDERVNKVTPELFKQFPTPAKMAQASLPEIEELIRSAGFYKNKAKSLKFCSQMLMDKHQGQIPKDLESLVELPGVGRKTANVVLGNAYGIVSGIVVDTHVSRLSQRLGWTRAKTPELIEKDLCKKVPEKNWIILSHWLIWHGRQVCQARRPRCEICGLADLCPKLI